MNEGATQSNSNLSVFLLGAILNILAAVDFSSLFDYSLKAVLGGVIWLLFKIIGEYITLRLKNSSTKDSEKE